MQDIDPSLVSWVSQSQQSGVAGVDPSLVGAGDWLEWEEELQEGGVELRPTLENLIDVVWTADNGRPPPSYKDIVVAGLEFAGVDWEDKVRERLRPRLAEAGYDGMVVTELDEVAWLYNLRGEGASHNEGLYHSPTFHSLSLVTQQELILWARLDKISPEVRSHLARPGCTDSCVELRDIEHSLKDLTEWLSFHPEISRLLLTKPSNYLSGASYAVYSALPDTVAKLDHSPVLQMKAVKNEAEISGMVEAHIKDAVAFCDWAAFMEEQIEVLGAENWTEISAAQLLSEYRLEQENSRGDSFGTISAYGANGAIIHYSPTPDTDAALSTDSLYMVDSGGQYLEGTTDITRTFHYGTPTDEMKQRYTEVLMGSVALASVVVPDKTLDTSVDLATRQFLFKQGLNYRHGTGHGIGAYLEVHEGPTLINMRGSLPGKFTPGIFFSDEPGYYQEGDWGLRLETILQVVPAELQPGDYGDFIQFQPVTLVPFEPKLIKFSLLSAEQKTWYNNYNKITRELVGARLQQQGRDRGYQWLLSRTEAVDLDI